MFDLMKRGHSSSVVVRIWTQRHMQFLLPQLAWVPEQNYTISTDANSIQLLEAEILHQESHARVPGSATGGPSALRKHRCRVEGAILVHDTPCRAGILKDRNRGCRSGSQGYVCLLRLEQTGAVEGT